VMVIVMASCQVLLVMLCVTVMAWACEGMSRRVPAALLQALDWHRCCGIGQLAGGDDACLGYGDDNLRSLQRSCLDDDGLLVMLVAMAELPGRQARCK
jgi:hypothetical protein